MSSLSLFFQAFSKENLHNFFSLLKHHCDYDDEDDDDEEVCGWLHDDDDDDI